MGGKRARGTHQLETEEGQVKTQNERESEGTHVLSNTEGETSQESEGKRERVPTDWRAQSEGQVRIRK